MALARSIAERQAGLLRRQGHLAARARAGAAPTRTSAQTDVRTAEGILTAARNRLRILGRSEAEVERVERERSIDPLITVTAPIGGTVIARKVGPGQYVRSDFGDQLYAIADLTTMWVKASVPESDIIARPHRPGDRGERRRHPGALVQSASDRHRRGDRPGYAPGAGTLRDSQSRWRPEIRDVRHFQDRDRPWRAGAGIATEAVVRDGDVTTVWVERAPMLFERRRVSLGLEEGGQVEVREGLKPGERVVGRGALLLDK